MTIIQATRQIIRIYIPIIEDAFIKSTKKSKTKNLFIILSMCHTILDNTYDEDINQTKNKMTDDKISRWLGFIQGIMKVYNILDIETERNTTRALFHKVYSDNNIEKPISITAKFNDIIFHIVDMQDFNNRCVKKYNVRSYKELSKDKLLKICFKIMKKSKPRVYKMLKKLNYTYEFRTENPNIYSFVFINPRLKNDS